MFKLELLELDDLDKKYEELREEVDKRTNDILISQFDKSENISIKNITLNLTDQLNKNIENKLNEQFEKIGIDPNIFRSKLRCEIKDATQSFYYGNVLILRVTLRIEDNLMYQDFEIPN